MNLKRLLRASAPHLSVGVVSANWMSLETDLRLLQEADVKLLHVDVMDGCFCPMMTFGSLLLSKIRTPMLKDVHLMIEEPLEKVEAHVAAGADIVTVHIESTRHVHRVLQFLGGLKNANDPERGVIRGVALNPGTPLSAIEPLIEDLDLVLLLAVNPGWGGQTFIPSTRDRLGSLKAMLPQRVMVGVDGGITRENAAEVVRNGADIVVTGSAVFDGRAPAENLRFLMTALGK